MYGEINGCEKCGKAIVESSNCETCGGDFCSECFNDKCPDCSKMRYTVFSGLHGGYQPSMTALAKNLKEAARIAQQWKQEELEAGNVVRGDWRREFRYDIYHPGSNTPFSYVRLDDTYYYGG